MNRISARTLTDAACYTVGGALYALSVNMFTAPNHIAPGGVTGAATLINYASPMLPIGLLSLALNLPLLWASWRRLGKQLTVRTAIVTLLVSAIIDLTAPFVPPFSGDRMLTAIFGGVLSGAGLGLIFLRGATTGGSELMARLLERPFPQLSVGRLILLVDGAVIAASAIVYGELESPLYAVVLVYVSTTVMDSIIYGSSKGRMMLIMTRRPQELTKAILQQIHRGVTLLDATGAYTGEATRVLLCAVRRSEVYQLRTLVTDMDPAAFIIITTSDEVVGKGFHEGDKT